MTPTETLHAYTRGQPVNKEDSNTLAEASLYIDDAPAWLETTTTTTTTTATTHRITILQPSNSIQCHTCKKRVYCNSAQKERLKTRMGADFETTYTCRQCRHAED